MEVDEGDADDEGDVDVEDLTKISLTADKLSISLSLLSPSSSVLYPPSLPIARTPSQRLISLFILTSPPSDPSPLAKCEDKVTYAYGESYDLFFILRLSLKSKSKYK